MKLLLRCEPLEASMERARLRAERLSCGERIKSARSINFERLEDLLQVLTAERLRLMEVVRTGTFSMTELALQLKRDPKSVRRDVSTLANYGLIRIRKQVNPGHGVRTIVVPVSRKIELRATL